jgi:hypothetical protein
LLDGTESHGLPFMFDDVEDDDDEYDECDDDDDRGDAYDDDVDNDQLDEPMPDLRSLSDADIEMIVRTAPPEIAKALKQIAANMGVSVLETLRRFVASGLPELMGAMGADSEPRRRAKKKSRS